MNKRIQEYLPKAIKILENEFTDKKIPSAYNGYISSFGASLIQSGLKITVALFEDMSKEDKTKADKSMLPKLILKLIDENTSEKSLLRYIINSQESEYILKQKIKDAAIALKLAIRTFELKKD